jgi:signal peptide peptidase SppA
VPPIGVHHTATVDTPWDGPAAEAALPNDAGEAVFRREYAWQDAEGDADTKAAYKFPHHEVSDGKPGAANLGGCRNGLSRLSGASVPDGDRAGIRGHLEAHLADAPSAGAEDFTPARQVILPRSYQHVADRVFDRPWAVSGGPAGNHPEMLLLMADIVRMRQSGLRFSVDELTERVAAVKGQQGDRLGGATVGTVAVIPMYGLISQRTTLMSDMSGGTSIDELRGALRDALSDPKVRAVVFDISSPGGSVDGIPEFADELRAVRRGSKPIVAQVNTLAASAAYWLAAQMSEIAVTPSGEVGSIGVCAVHEDLSKAEELAGIKTSLISAGPFKTEGNQFEPLDPEARGAIQGQVDDFYAMFLADVAKGRKTSVDGVAQGYGGGRTLLAKAALQAGMVDAIATLDQTVARFQSTPAASSRAAITPLPAAVAASLTTPIQPDRAWTQRMKGRLRK